MANGFKIHTTYVHAIPMICGKCERPIGYIMNDIGDPLTDFLNKVSNLLCEKCFNEENKDPQV